MKTLLLAFCLTFGGLYMNEASACTSISTDTQETYFVSGVMTKNGAEATIKLLHSVVRERSESDALQAFFKTAMAQYPDYKMVSVLASKETSIACQKQGGIFSI